MTGYLLLCIGILVALQLLLIHKTQQTHDAVNSSLDAWKKDYIELHEKLLEAARQLSFSQGQKDERDKPPMTG